MKTHTDFAVADLFLPFAVFVAEPVLAWLNSWARFFLGVSMAVGVAGHRTERRAMKQLLL